MASRQRSLQALQAFQSAVRCRALALVAASYAITGSASAQSASAVSAEQYLRTLDLGAAQLRAADAGQVVVKLLKTEDPRDVAVFGMVAVRVPRDSVVARAIERHGFVVAQGSRTGLFGTPPTAADVADVSFDRSEYKALRGCRPGDCDFKLSASAMQGFSGGVDWSSPNAKREADERLRTDVLRLVTEYETRGNAAMPTYDDGGGVRSADSFDAVLAQSAPTLSAFAPELQRYLATYPSERPAAARDFIYWRELRLPRMRPTLLVDHAVVYTPPNAPAFVARKQIYASHYFEAALELLAAIEGEAEGGATVTYLITVRRFRFDYLPGGILNVRGRVRNHMVDAMRDDLTRERSGLDSAAPASAR